MGSFVFYGFQFSCSLRFLCSHWGIFISAASALHNLNQENVISYILFTFIDSKPMSNQSQGVVLYNINTAHFKVGHWAV